MKTSKDPVKFTKKQKKAIISAFIEAAEKLHRNKAAPAPADWLASQTGWNRGLCYHYVRGIRPVQLSRAIYLEHLCRKIVTADILRPDIFKRTRN